MYNVLACLVLQIFLTSFADCLWKIWRKIFAGGGDSDLIFEGSIQLPRLLVPNILAKHAWYLSE
jgi:hypothetical protein